MRSRELSETAYGIPKPGDTHPDLRDDNSTECVAKRVIIGKWMAILRGDMFAESADGIRETTAALRRPVVCGPRGRGRAKLRSCDWKGIGGKKNKKTLGWETSRGGPPFSRLRLREPSGSTPNQYPAPDTKRKIYSTLRRVVPAASLELAWVLL